MRRRTWIFLSGVLVIAIVVSLIVVNSGYYDPLANQINEYLRVNGIIVDTSPYQTGYGVDCYPGGSRFYPNCWSTIKAVYAYSTGFSSVQRNLDSYIGLLRQYGIDEVIFLGRSGWSGPLRWVGGVKEASYSANNPRFLYLITLEVYT